MSDILEHNVIEEYEKREHYVYVYLDPRKTDYNWSFKHNRQEQWFDLEPFYVGLGKKNRILHHIHNKKPKNEQNLIKTSIIQKLRSRGYDNEYFKNFLIIKLVTNLTLDEANIIEEQLVNRFGRRIVDPNGILSNMRKGGEVGRYSEETCRIIKRVFMIDKNKRILNTYKSTKEAAEKTNLTYTKINDSFHSFDYKLVIGGILLYEETFNDKEKLEKIIIKINNEDKRIVLLNRDYNFVKLFENIVEASKETNVITDNISQCLGGWKFLCENRYAFVYLKTYNNPDEFKIWMDKTKPKKQKKIGQYDLDENLIRIFYTITEVLQFLNIKSDFKLVKAAKLSEKAYGFIWKFID